MELERSCVRKKGGGRKSIISRFPGAIQVLKQYLAESEAADRSRRLAHGLVGVTSKELLGILKRNIPNFPNVSPSTIRRLTVPPNKTRSSSIRYRNLLNIKIIHPQNKRVTNPHIDTHYNRCQVRLLKEMATRFGDEVTMFSCDDKAKLKLGKLPLVHRLVKSRKYYNFDERPTTEDHEFPSGQSIIPSGYLALDCSMSDITYVDANNRTRYANPKAGTCYLILRSMLAYRGTERNHAYDFISVYNEHKCQKKNIIILSDNGPD